MTSGRFALRQALTAVHAAQRERVWTRSTRSEAMMCCRRRMLRAIANGFLVAAGKRTKRPPIACSSPASPRESVATSALAPVSARAAVTASVARSSPPAASDGTIWRSSGRRAARLPRARKERAHQGSRRAESRTRELDARTVDLRRELRQARAALRDQVEVHPARSAGRMTNSELNVSDGQPQVFIVGNAPNQRRIAFRRRAPVRSGGPGVVWLSGYRSDMDSTKATALDAEAERRGLGLLRFDYSGHGRSDGRLEDGTISRWLEESLALVRAESEGPQILVGSSMGGYLALLAVRALSEAGETERVKGLILIAPAVDFTEALIWAKAPDEARRAIMEKAYGDRPSAYSSEPDCFTRDLIEDGRKHLLLGGMIRTGAPTAVLQGMRDEDVPFSHALALMQRFGGDPRR